MSDLFDQLFIVPIINALVAFFKAYQLIGLPGAFGLAIISVTALIRLLLAPLTKKQLQSATQMAKIQPKLKQLQKKHKNDATRLQQEQFKLYKEAGVNPAAGCLPVLVQLPLFFALFRVFTQLLDTNMETAAVDRINTVVYWPILHITTIDFQFFGLDLTVRPSQWQTVGIAIVLVPLVTALLQYVQTRYTMQQSAAKKHGQKNKKQEQNDDGDDMSQSLQKQMAILSPIMIGVVAYSLPAGLALYWNVFTVFGILQQRVINKTT